jgi:hypothetical protein
VSTRSAASMNDVDTDERRLMMGVDGTASRAPPGPSRWSGGTLVALLQRCYGPAPSTSGPGRGSGSRSCSIAVTDRRDGRRLGVKERLRLPLRSASRPRSGGRRHPTRRLQREDHVRQAIYLPGRCPWAPAAVEGAAAVPWRGRVDVADLSAESFRDEPFERRPSSGTATKVGVGDGRKPYALGL